MIWDSVRERRTESLTSVSAVGSVDLRAPLWPDATGGLFGGKGAVMTATLNDVIRRVRRIWTSLLSRLQLSSWCGWPTRRACR